MQIPHRVCGIDDAGVDAAGASRAVGAMIFSLFGAVLLEVWSRRAGAGVTAVCAIAVLGCALLAVAYRRYRRGAALLVQQDATPRTQRARRVLHIVNAAQWVVILVLGNILANLGYGAWVVPMAIVVIGLHFVPLAYVFDNPPHYLLAAAMVGFAVVYPQVAPAGPADPIGFLGTGLLLWLSAAWALRGAFAGRG